MDAICKRIRADTSEAYHDILAVRFGKAPLTVSHYGGILFEAKLLRNRSIRHDLFRIGKTLKMIVTAALAAKTD
jgi:hypothetical protein